MYYVYLRTVVSQLAIFDVSDDARVLLRGVDDGQPGPLHVKDAVDLLVVCVVFRLHEPVERLVGAVLAVEAAVAAGAVLCAQVDVVAHRQHRRREKEEGGGGCGKKRNGR